MDSELCSMWKDINDKCFGGELLPLADIDWGETSGKNGFRAHGFFSPKSRCIAIDQIFRFSADAIRSGDKTEEANAMIAYGLMMHEMVHQALHQRNVAQPNGHGDAFLEEAQRIAALTGESSPTAENVRSWPLNFPVEN